METPGIPDQSALAQEGDRSEGQVSGVRGIGVKRGRSQGYRSQGGREVLQAFAGY